MLKIAQASRSRKIIKFIRSITLRQAPLHSRSQLAPIFIVGCGRSGNTLVRRVLMASGKIYIPPETYVLDQIIRNFSQLSYLPWKTQINMALGSIVASHDFKYFPQCNYHEIVSKLAKTPLHHQTCADLLDTLYNEWARAAGMSGARWGDKTPLNTSCLHEIIATFPDAKFIYIQRSLYDVVASYLRMGRYSSAKDATERWIKSNQDCIAFRDKNRPNTLTMKYEDLVSLPSECFSSIFRFLGLDFRQEFLDCPAEKLPMGDQKVSHYKNLNSQISKGSVNRGKLSLSKADLQEIDDLLENNALGRELRKLV